MNYYLLNTIEVVRHKIIVKARDYDEARNFLEANPGLTPISGKFVSELVDSGEEIPEVQAEKMANAYARGASKFGSTLNVIHDVQNFADNVVPFPVDKTVN